jgi:beta-N-acetylhexosaminidase
VPPLRELRRLAGAVLCVGVPGGPPDAALLRALADLQPGGLILFERNVTTPAETKTRVDALVAACEGAVRPFVAVDQEGGRVARLGAGAAQIPAMMAVGATGDLALAERVGRALARDVRRFGANLDFAPVLDLALVARSTIVGTRAFGDDPRRVAALGSALIRGLRAGGVAAVAKHFPGHGNTALDSHRALPVVATDAATLRERELVPFRAAFAADVECVMSAHVVVPALESDVPATLSRHALTDVLRGELRFEGVCFTDCLEMEAIASSIGTAPAAARAIAAGADCALVSHRLALAFAAREAIVEAVRTGELSPARLEGAAERVGRLRAALERARPEPFEDAPDVARAVAERAITQVRGRAALDGTQPVTVVSFEGAAREPGSLNLALRRRRLRSELLRAPLEPDAEMSEQLVALLAAQPGREVVVVTRRAHVFGLQRRAVEAILAIAPEAVIVSVLEPFDVLALPQARNVLCAYGDCEPTVEALADVLSGRLTPTGELPVRGPFAS